MERNIRPQDKQPAEQYHLVNHWSWLGCFDDAKTALKASEDNHQTVFDRDAYRMLMSALRKGKLELVDVATMEPVDNPLIRENFD